MIPLSNPTLICPTLSTFWTENVASSHSLWRFAEAPWLLASAHWAPGFKEIDLRHRKSGAHQTISASKYMGLILGIWWTSWRNGTCLQICFSWYDWKPGSSGQFPPWFVLIQNWSLRILRPVAEVPYCSTLAKAQQKQRRWQLLTAGGFLWGKSWKTPKFWVDFPLLSLITKWNFC